MSEWILIVGGAYLLVIIAIIGFCRGCRDDDNEG